LLFYILPSINTSEHEATKIILRHDFLIEISNKFWWNPEYHDWSSRL